MSLPIPSDHPLYAHLPPTPPAGWTLLQTERGIVRDVVAHYERGDLCMSVGYSPPYVPFDGHRLHVSAYRRVGEQFVPLCQDDLDAVDRLLALPAGNWTHCEVVAYRNLRRPRPFAARQSPPQTRVRRAASVLREIVRTVVSHANAR